MLTLLSPHRLPAEVAYNPQGVQFDGTNDYLARGGDLTGNANSKLVTGSFWMKLPASPGFFYIWTSQSTASSNPRFGISFDGASTLVLTGQNSSSTTILSMTSNAVLSNTSWRHVMFSFDLSDTNKRHIYIDDSDEFNAASTYTNDTIDLSPASLRDHILGARDFGLGAFNIADCDLADFWLDFGTYVDLSVSSNRRKFVGASAATSVDLGSDGSTPTGSAPIVYLSGETSTWHTNDGTGGGFTENGALTDSATSPPSSA